MSLNNKWHLMNYRRMRKMGFWYSQYLKRAIDSNEYYIYDSHHLCWNISCDIAARSEDILSNCGTTPHYHIFPTYKLKKYCVSIIENWWGVVLFKRRLNFERYHLWHDVMLELYYYPEIGQGYFCALDSFKRMGMAMREGKMDEITDHTNNSQSLIDNVIVV